MGQAESDSSPIPLLTDVLVPGNPALARTPAADAPHDDAAIPVLIDVIAPAATASAAPAVAGVGPAEVEADPDKVVVEPVPTPDVPAVELAPGAVVATAAAVPAAHAAELAVLTPEDAQRIAERLRNRLTQYLTGAGRDAIEARCRDALHDHSAWLVGQITREVALALESEVMEWVRDAVDDEIARRRAGHSG